MAFLHVLSALLVMTVLTAGAADESPRKVRTPGLLHLAHAGHSVGSYLGRGAGGDGGPHIVIVGQPAHITTHVASKDSLEELDQELRQHYGSSGALQGGHYVLPSAGTFRTFPGYHHGYTQLSTGVQHPLAHAVSPAPHYSVTPSSIAYAPPHNYIQGVSPTYTPASNFAHGVTPANNYAHSVTPASNYPAQSATPSSVNQPHSVTPAPLTHTLATPGISHSALPGRLPLHPLHSGFHGLGYHQGPVFIPVQAVSHQPHFQGHPGLVLGRVPYHNSQSEQDDDHPVSSDEGRNGYYDNEERRPSHFNREFDSSSVEKSRENSGFENNYKFGSEEGFARSSPQTFFRSHPSEDQGSYEESGSHERDSDERTAADSGTYQTRALHGDGKVATSYQSVTLETHQRAPPYLQKAHSSS